MLFPEPEEAQALQQRGLMLRRGVQFHWRNHDWQDFEQFLGAMSHDKRKKIRQERRKVTLEKIASELGGSALKSVRFFRSYSLRP